MRGKEKAFPAGPQHTWAGLTKREWIATQILNTLLQQVSSIGVNDDHTIQLSIQLADRVIALCDETEEATNPPHR